MVDSFPWTLGLVVLFFFGGMILRKRQRARIEEQDVEVLRRSKWIHSFEKGILFVHNEVELIALKVGGDLLHRFIELLNRLADKLDHLTASRDKAGLGSRD